MTESDLLKPFVNYLTIHLFSLILLKTQGKIRDRKIFKTPVIKLIFIKKTIIIGKYAYL